MTLTKDFFEANMLRLHDRIDDLESKINKLLEGKTTMEKYLDNQDMMNLTMMSASTLYRRRKSGKLPYLNRGGKNFYLPEVAMQFMHDEWEPK